MVDDAVCLDTISRSSPGSLVTQQASTASAPKPLCAAGRSAMGSLIDLERRPDYAAVSELVALTAIY
jgi:hypothetical protein